MLAVLTSDSGDEGAWHAIVLRDDRRVGKPLEVYAPALEHRDPATVPAMPRSEAPATHDALRVAIDVGPLYGHRTGIGVAVQGMVDSLGARTDVALDRFVVSSRADLTDADRRLPLPGIVASHLWSRSSFPAPTAGSSGVRRGARHQLRRPSDSATQPW